MSEKQPTKVMPLTVDADCLGQLEEIGQELLASFAKQNIHVDKVDHGQTVEIMIRFFHKMKPFSRVLVSMSQEEAGTLKSLADQRGLSSQDMLTKLIAEERDARNQANH